MRILLLGATGNLGLRLVPALLSHNHTIIAYVRSPSKLESLLPASVFESLTVVQGDSTDSHAIKTALLEAKCDALINTSGGAAMAPWKSSNFPQLFHAVVDAVCEAGAERGKPLRVWMLGGIGVLKFPGTETDLSTYIPIFLEHRKNIALLRSLPPQAAHWSMLCPSVMTPESTDFSVPTKATTEALVARAGSPPTWNDYWFRHVPLIGRFLAAAVNAGRYETRLEQAAEFIARDLEEGGTEWVGEAVGIIGRPK